MDESNERLLSASADGKAAIWDLHTGTRLTPWLGHDNEVTVAEFSPNGRLVATGSRDRTARLWHAKDGTSHGPALQHEDLVLDAAFSPDGRYLLTASGERKARLWCPVSVQLLAETNCHHVGILTASFHPESTHYLTADAGGEVFVHALPVIPAIAPHWLPTFIETLAGKHLSNEGVSSAVSTSSLEDLKPTLMGEIDFYARWAKWRLGIDH